MIVPVINPSKQPRLAIICLLSYLQLIAHPSVPIMSAVPQGAFAARKVRKNEEMIKYASPEKYNEKYMNSVWGMYNKYSVHNLKRNYDNKVNGEQKNFIGKNQVNRSTSPISAWGLFGYM